ncbi:MAG TPA: L-aspartate oxidase [Acidimicrobiales bacterium]|nr:L-aspartate oxidase [Acidimicrobiales bacterium]
MGTGPDTVDVLVIGAGIAGLSTALELAGRRRVVVLAKDAGPWGSTALAQGGIAAALSTGDSASAHAEDTVAAAAGLGDPAVAEMVTAEAADAVAALASLGVQFDIGAPAREGGHRCARVVHASGDATGAEISRALRQAADTRRVPIVSGTFLVDLLVEPDRPGVVGALVWDSGARALRSIRASSVVLATGGYGQLWASATSSPACTGDGLAAALRAGAQVADLEFVQFHPTGMAIGRDPRPLASEALRGAGARLRDTNGEYLHQATGAGAGDLAPRDVVSRAMARRMTELGAGSCYLDATGLGREVLETRFPTFVSSCRAAGIEPSEQWVPVSPTAHYTMGGVLTDGDGRTTLEGLMAVGEAACSGLHGANRLASNSLLEGAVIGQRAAGVLLESSGAVAPREAVEVEEVVLPSVRMGRPLERQELRDAMELDAGIARDAEGLGRLAFLLASAGVPEGAPARSGGSEVANMRLVAEGVVALAARREESRGAHWRTDHPQARPEWCKRQVLQLLPGDEMGVGDIAVAEPCSPAVRPFASAR